MAKPLSVLCVDASLLVSAGLIEHAPLFETKGLDGFALGRVRRNLPSGAVVHGPFCLSSRTGFLGSAVRRPFGAGCGVALVSLPRARRLAGFALGLGVDAFADAVELDRALGGVVLRPG